MKFLPLIWSNLQRKKLRTVLTLLSVLVAFFLYGYLCAIGQSLGNPVSMAGADRLFVRHRVSIAQLLPVSYKTRIERLPGVAAVSHACWFGGVYRDPKNLFAQLAVEPESWLAVFPEYLLTEEAKRTWFATRTGAIVGRRTAERFGWKVGDKIPIQGTIWLKKDGGKDWAFDLVGIYDGAKGNTDTTQLFFRHDYFDETRLFKEGQTGWFLVRIADPAHAAELARRIDEEFANSPEETKAEPEGALVQGLARQLGNVTAIVFTILSAVFFTILLVAGNTMAQGVRERTAELGVLKALGFTHTRVLGLVLAESCLLSTAGGLPGLGFAWALISAGDPSLGALPLFHFAPGNVATGALLVLVLGLVTGMVPALQAMRLRIADALRTI
jgi:putative ABC transport system permease protein